MDADGADVIQDIIDLGNKSNDYSAVIVVRSPSQLTNYFFQDFDLVVVFS
ncbi:MAG TPA: hypothetical protein V6D15_13695 [Oculatellaceae cyanobacterium]|jgi:hypothetical protein